MTSVNTFSASDRTTWFGARAWYCLYPSRGRVELSKRLAIELQSLQRDTSPNLLTVLLELSRSVCALRHLYLFLKSS